MSIPNGDTRSDAISCKQVLTIALAVVLFDLKIAPTNAIGILLTLIGGVSRRCRSRALD